MSVTIDELPSEILDYIFHLLPPYEDVRNCRAVSRKWNMVARGIIPRVQRSFGDALTSQNVVIEFPPTKREGITKRYAHSACRYHDSMYVFGGFTSSFSSFNDLWRLDFSTRVWTRIRADGRCPVPKAGATMVTYDDKLVLFGGMLPHAHDSLSQPTRSFSNNIQTFDLKTNTWGEITFAEDTRVPGLARHSATIHNHKMIIFGGLEERRCNNDLYSLDLRTMDWQHVAVPGEKPSPRFGQSQVFIDDMHLLIMGGIDTKSTIMEDAWLLDMSSEPWQWSKVDLGTHVLLMRAIWCHSVCKVGKYIVIFKPMINNPSMYADWFPIPIYKRVEMLPKIIVRDANVNGKRGILSRNWSNSENAHGEDRLRHKMASSNIGELRSLNTFRNAVELHMLDTSYLLEHGRLTHVRGKSRPLNCPSDTILYSVVEGNGELFLFGGIQRNVVSRQDDSNQENIPQIINTLKIIKLKKEVV